MNGPREFVLHWHAAARLAPPRFVPDAWLRQADSLLGKGITAEDLTLVAKWMLAQLARSQSGERNSVAFNAASFRWTKMFGEFGASNQHERFLEFLAAAAAARKPAERAAQAPCTAAATPLSDDEWRRRAEAMRAVKSSIARELEGGP